MNKKIGLFWLKDDFRLKKNLALSEATKNHDTVVAFYLFKKKKFKNQEAQKWWIVKSLDEFKIKLNSYNINLEIIETESYEVFFKKLFKKKDFSIYWNKIYEPSYLAFDQFLSKNFKDKQINFKIFKGNILNEFEDVKKDDGTPFKVFTPFWRRAEKIYLERIPKLEKKVSKCKKRVSYFKNSIKAEKFYPNKEWFKKFESHWFPSEENAINELKDFIKNKIENYDVSRNFPNIVGTSTLSPFIKHGQIHVETIWEECTKIKKGSTGKFLAEIGWREFNHSLINYFPHMLKGNYSKKFDKFPGKKTQNFYLLGKKDLQVIQ